MTKNDEYKWDDETNIDSWQWGWLSFIVKGYLFGDLSIGSSLRLDYLCGLNGMSEEGEGGGGERLSNLMGPLSKDRTCFWFCNNLSIAHSTLSSNNPKSPTHHINFIKLFNYLFCYRLPRNFSFYLHCSETLSMHISHMFSFFFKKLVEVGNNKKVKVRK